MGKFDDIPKIEEKTEAELDEIIKIIKDNKLPEKVEAFVLNCIDAALWFPNILQKYKMSMQRFNSKRFILKFYECFNKLDYPFCLQ